MRSLHSCSVHKTSKGLNTAREVTMDKEGAKLGTYTVHVRGRSQHLPSPLPVCSPQHFMLAHLHPPACSPPQGRKWCNWGSQGLSNASQLFHILLLACAKQPVHVFHNCTYQVLYEHLHCPTQESHQLPMSSLMPKVRGLHLPVCPGTMRNTSRNLNCNIIHSKIILLRMRWKTSQRMGSLETF